MKINKFLASLRWPAIFNISAIFFAFVTSVLAARLLGVQQYGFLQYLLSIAQLAQFVLGLGMATQVLKASGEEGQSSDKGELDHLILRSVVIFIAMLAPAAAVVAIIWKISDHLSDIDLVALTFCFALAQHILSLFRSALVGKSKFQMAGSGEFASGIIVVFALGSMLLLGLKDQSTVAAVLGVRISAAAIGCAILILGWFALRDRRHIQVKSIWDPHRALISVRVGLPIMLVGVGAILNSSADIILLGILRTDGEVGEYHVATRAAAFIGIPLTIIMVPFAPMISRLFGGYLSDLKDLLLRVSLMTGFGSLSIGVVLYCLSDQFFGLFGPDFMGAKNATVVLGLAQIINSFCGPVQQLLIMTGSQVKACISTLCGVFVNIALNLMLIPHYGVLGAAFGTAASILVQSIINTWLVQSGVFNKQSGPKDQKFDEVGNG